MSLFTSTVKTTMGIASIIGRGAAKIAEIVITTFKKFTNKMDNEEVKQEKEDLEINEDKEQKEKEIKIKSTVKAIGLTVTSLTFAIMFSIPVVRMLFVCSIVFDMCNLIANAMYKMNC